MKASPAIQSAIAVAAIHVTALVPLTRAAPTAEQISFFEAKIRPVLAEKCYKCHSVDSEKLKGGLMLDSLASVLRGGDTGAAIEPGDADASLMIESLRYGDPDFQMPPKGKLADEIIADFEEWVTMGAPWPDEAEPVRADGASAVEVFDLDQRKTEHWSWQAIEKPAPPAVANRHWINDPLDTFILAGLEAADLRPADDAAPATWLRRVYFDLIGLPPTADELENFERDLVDATQEGETEGQRDGEKTGTTTTSPSPLPSIPPSSPQARTTSTIEKVYAKTVDQLLASPHFGERWARHWMDLARYGETCGHEFDYPIPHARDYRDYLVRAFNADLPYDQFVREHVAGDQLNEPRLHPDTATNESIVGTGFWFLHESVHAPTDVRLWEADHIDNRIDALSRGFLGLTVSCARCHDHKFDAIPTTDYYALAGYLQSSRRVETPLDPGGQIEEAMTDLGEKHQQGSEALRRAFGQLKAHADFPIDTYLRTALEIVRDPQVEEPGAAPSADGAIVFEDFEASDFGDWEIEGDAFGTAPTAGPTTSGQELSGFVGKRLANSYAKTDKKTGTLTSRTFTIEHDYIHFLIGGGNHAQKTCVQLIIDGKVAREATGKNTDAMAPVSWEVSDLAGLPATLKIIDQEPGGWGHIEVDHIVFSNQAEFDFAAAARPPINRRQLTEAAKRDKLDVERLAAFVEALREPEAKKDPAHPMHFLITGKAPATEEVILPLREGETVFADFSPLPNAGGGNIPAGWQADGSAFTSSAATMTNGGEWTPGDPERLLSQAGVLHGGALAAKSEGALRSPTFEITAENLHLRFAGQNVIVRLIIDGYDMNLFHTLLFRGSILKGNLTDTGGDFAWKTMSGNLDKYLGHRAYLEILDQGNGWIALDEIRFSEDKSPPASSASAAGLAASQLAKLPKGKSDPTAGYYLLWGSARARLAENQAMTDGEVELINFLWKHDLIPFAENSKDHKAFAAIDRQIREQAAGLPRPDYALAMIDGTPEDEHVFIRGSHKSPGELVPRRFLAALGGEQQTAPADSSGRLELAQQMLADDNPLAARVIVNRLWHHLFGRGIVPTVDDFGVMGQPPSNPELLDHLASEFRTSHQWSIKSTLRSMVLSRTYRMSSIAHPDNDPERLAEIDPDNILLHRAPVRRLQAEAIRDAILTVSGRLDRTIGGDSVPVHLTAFMQGRGRPGKSGPVDGEGRRSLYLEIRRNFLNPMMLAFDMPSPFSAMGRRSVSNVPSQSLMLMNDPFVLEQAAQWADFLSANSDLGTDRERLSLAFRQAFSREPDAHESGRLLAFLEAADDGDAAWRDLCHVLFNKKELIYLN